MTDLPDLSPLTWPDYDALLRAGVDKHVMAALYADKAVGADDIHVSGKRWERRYRGDRAIVIPVHGPDGEVADLVAFKLETPRSFWTFAGDAPLLGLESLAYATHYETPLTVHESPLDWLRAGGEGVVVLDWAHYWPMWFGDVPALKFDDRDVARRASAIFQRPFPVPPILQPAAA